MLRGACLGTNDLERAGRFYDRLLATIDWVRLIEVEREIGYGPRGGRRCFWILKPFNGLPATWGNGTQVMFEAPDAATVDRFHRTALDLGGTDEGAPGFRYRPTHYAAYCRDLDGNKLYIAFDP